MNRWQQLLGGNERWGEVTRGTIFLKLRQPPDRKGELPRRSHPALDYAEETPVVPVQDQQEKLQLIPQVSHSQMRHREAEQSLSPPFSEADSCSASCSNILLLPEWTLRKCVTPPNCDKCQKWGVWSTSFCVCQVQVKLRVQKLKNLCKSPQSIQGCWGSQDFSDRWMQPDCFIL